MVARVSVWSGPKRDWRIFRALANSGSALAAWPKGAIRSAKSNLKVRHDRWVADRFAFQVDGRPVQPIAQDCSQWPPFFILCPRVEILEDRAEDLGAFLDLFKAFLGSFLGLTLSEPCGFGPRQPD